MKVLLFCPDSSTAASIAQAIEAAGHVITDIVLCLAMLEVAIIRDIPQLLFAVDIPNNATWDFESSFPDLMVCATASKADWRAALQDRLAVPCRPYTPRRYADGTRRIFHDESLRAYSKGKLHRPHNDPGWEKECQRQEAAFLLQLHSGSRNHGAAQRYLACLMEQEPDLEQEICYRTCHTSYKGLCWARDLAARYCAVLAHYIFGVELDYLPSPHAASPSSDYVHQQPSLWSIYAVVVVAAGHPRTTSSQEVSKLLHTCFSGQTDEQLVQISTELFGLASLLRIVAVQQVRLMDWWLDPVQVRFADTLPRSTHRAAGIFREFWGMDYIIHSPAPLNSLLQGYHAGTTHLVEYPIIAPSFREVSNVAKNHSERTEQSGD